MKHDTWIKWTIGLGLVLALGMGLANGSHQAQAQDGAVQGAAGLQEAVSTAFTYQGRVLHLSLIHISEPTRPY